MTRTGTMMGTLVYMSPEQVLDTKHIDYRTDIYSLAVTFAQLLSGKAPYDSDTSGDYAIRKGIVEEEFDLSGVPTAWRGFLRSYLAKDPNARPTLRPFEVVSDTSKAKRPVSELKTVTDAKPQQFQPAENQTHLPQQNIAAQRKNKTSLWAGLGVGGAVLLLLLVLLLKPSSTSSSYVEPPRQTAQTTQPTQTTSATQTNKPTSTATTNVQRSSVPTGAAQGLFSVGNNKQVYFSKGNLQYQASTNTWRFANNPWDCAGDANTNISSSYSGWIDLFGWGTGNNPTMSSSSKSSYGSFYDWGSNAVSNGGSVGWRTLTSEEWAYVFDRRSISSGVRYAKAYLNGVGGVVLLPDNWNASKYRFNNVNSSSTDYSANSISTADWNSILQPNGAVFLPASGGRLERKVVNVGKGGGYWAASNEGDRARYLYVRKDDLNAQGTCGRMNGFSVRLVCSANR